MAKKRQERREERRKGRMARREFAVVATDAVTEAYTRGWIDLSKADDIAQALKRPRGVNLIREQFLTDSGKAGNIDFDKWFDLLTGFFPKLANLKKFFGIFQRIRQIAKEPA